ncbi:MAG TPA: CDP-alcohol phosphatidyltransferase family protein [Sulfurovum sp.]|jgi:CDP-diacylglycerol--serine O-phosphatidyltransferase|nr:MAG: phosphatidylserine synthase [Sulfurovum sp. 28-43-6]OYZ50026.1 MAG: phosphatidylserine synthase [Sulfurovum sp. 24-42-9]OZA61546.1 MAG: phosphatidylserine synthase [Sulfurovum sp. 39-42-12]HQR72926.1 CDP-alcohol phosphatidyltransferase family protein [Sulfurovum sp.]HQS72320.1 CDP-alcohol phosphatidyltransferase family protein [Sulfurovum sp.]
MNLFDKNNRFNIANIVTYLNVSAGVMAIFFIVKGDFFTAIILAWIAGACDIIDGKLARKYNLSTEFGIQLDSFADFLSFVVMPAFLLFYALKKQSALADLEEIVVGLVFVWYIISGLRRLVEFNLKMDVGEVAKYFEGVPTPLGAILLWILYLLNTYGVLTSGYLVAALVMLIAWSLNSTLKIPHP